VKSTAAPELQLNPKLPLGFFEAHLAPTKLPDFYGDNSRGFAVYLGSMQHQRNNTKPGPIKMEDRCRLHIVALLTGVLYLMRFGAERRFMHSSPEIPLWELVVVPRVPEGLSRLL